MVDARKAKFPCLAPDDERVFNVVEKPHAFWIERVRAYGARWCCLDNASKARGARS